MLRNAQVDLPFVGFTHFHLGDSHRCDLPLKQSFIFQYSIVSEDSFKELTYFRDRIISVKDDDHPPPMILVGNDSELEDNRVVSQPMGRALAKKFGCPFMEVSTRDDVNVEEAFVAISRTIVRESKNFMPRPKPRGLLGFLRPGRSTTSSRPAPPPLNLFLITHGVDLAAARYALVIFLCDGLLKVNKQSENDPVIFLCDGLLRINKHLKNDPTARFFGIAKRLPMEIQMLLCQRAARNRCLDDISSEESGLAFFVLGEFFRRNL